MNRSFKRSLVSLPVWGRVGLVLASSCVLFMAGCDAPIDAFPSNRIFAKRWEISESIDLEQPVKDSRVVLEELFGTPDEPKWPAFLEVGQNQITEESLKRAAGAFSSDEDGLHVGLFREHCVVCHGVSGDGLGPSAGLLNPYPRDFRLGRVKFKSTPIGEKPTRSDLKKILMRGIAGTSMPSFKLLDDTDIDALIDYVVYLSVRGELERKLLSDAAIELDLDSGERLYDRELARSFPEEFAEVEERIQGWAAGIYAEWIEAEESVLKVIGPPAGFPMVGSEAEEAAIAESVANGKELFNGTVASCSFCHGAEAKGDGQINNYDDWTRDWTTLAGLDPKDRKQIQPMLDLGALKPRNILPRNLTLGVFHGGSSPEELYTRIVKGIEGTNMPAAPIKPANPRGLTNQEVWDLVNYLRSFLPPAEQRLDPAPSEVSKGDDQSGDVGQPNEGQSGDVGQPNDDEPKGGTDNE